MASDLYRILDVGKLATAEEVRAAYLRLASEIHPDLNSQDAAAELRFKQIQTAYEILGNPLSRAEYDRKAKRRRARTTAASSTSQKPHVATSAAADHPWQRHDRMTASFGFLDHSPTAHATNQWFLLVMSASVFVIVVALVGVERWSAYHKLPRPVQSVVSSDRDDINATNDVSAEGDVAFDPLSHQRHEVGDLAKSEVDSPAPLNPDSEKTTQSPDEASDQKEVGGTTPAASGTSPAHSRQQIVVDRTRPITAAEFFAETAPLKDLAGNTLRSSGLGIVNAGLDTHWDPPTRSLLESPTLFARNVGWPLNDYPVTSTVLDDSALPQWQNASVANNDLSRVDGYAAMSRHFGAARHVEPFTIGTGFQSSHTAAVSGRTTRETQLQRQPYGYTNVGNPSPIGGHPQEFGAHLLHSNRTMRETNIEMGVGSLPAYRTPTLQSVLPTHGSSFTFPGRTAAGAARVSSLNW